MPLLGFAVLRKSANQSSEDHTNSLAMVDIDGFAHGKHIPQPQSTNDDWLLPQLSLEPESSALTSSDEQHPPTKFPIKSTQSHIEATKTKKTFGQDWNAKPSDPAPTVRKLSPTTELIAQLYKSLHNIPPHMPPYNMNIEELIIARRSNE